MAAWRRSLVVLWQLAAALADVCVGVNVALARIVLDRPARRLALAVEVCRINKLIVAFFV